VTCDAASSSTVGSLAAREKEEGRQVGDGWIWGSVGKRAAAEAWVTPR
jgi:hypothetical protein